MAEKEEKKGFPIMIIAVILVICCALAGGISYYVVTKFAGERQDRAVIQETGTLMKVGDGKDGIIINIGGLNSGRYLKIGVSLEIKSDKKEQESGGKTQSPEEIKIQDTVIYSLRSQKLEDFEPAKQEHLKELIKNEVNKALGKDVVLNVYITNFVLQ
ncbi:MAG: flagellar basal body-associated protein FliL [Firmicutes bacterium]|nr:flagellar basal body-associated protein FliL [Bacillota bacterium]